MRVTMSWRAGVASLVATAAVALGVGCTPSAKSDAPAGAGATAQSGPTGQAAVEEAELLFQNRCTPCHGAGGHGDGPGAAALDPKPRNFTLSDWQAKVNDAHIEQVIVYGGAAVGLNPNMPGNPDLNEKPEVVKALRAHVRSLAGK